MQTIFKRSFMLRIIDLYLASKACENQHNEAIRLHSLWTCQFVGHALVKKIFNVIVPLEVQKPIVSITNLFKAAWFKRKMRLLKLHSFSQEKYSSYITL